MEASVMVRRRRQRGFTMVELLITFFILAVGLMGLGMLQVMSMKVNLTSRSYGQGVFLAEQVMDQIHSEARVTQKWVREQFASPVTSLEFMPPANGAYPDLYFTIDGTRQVIASPNSSTYYTVRITREELIPATAGDMQGGLSRFTVSVVFKDAIDPKNPGQLIERKITMNREIGYAVAA